MSDRSQRTEKPTPQRIRKARNEGRFPASKELVAAVQFAVSVALLVGMADYWWPRALIGIKEMLALAFTVELSPSTVIALLRHHSASIALPFFAGGGMLFAAGMFAQLSATQFGLATARLAPDFKKLNPVSKLKDLPKQNLRSAVEAALLLPLMLGAVYLVVGSQFPAFISLPLLDLHSGLAQVGQTTSSLLWRSALLLLIWGLIDFARQKKRYMRDLKMTKQEVREEWKQNEGSPEMKMRLRRMRRDLLRRRMMSDVATATVVVVNPTHFAVALKYGLHSPGAPKVVAKGKNYLALRIKARAIENGVPIVENKPLAQALYKGCAVGQEIPAQLYKAVAEVLAYVYRIMNGRL